MRVYIGTYSRFGGPGVVQMTLEQDKIRLLTANDELCDAIYVVRAPDGQRFYADDCTSPMGHLAAYDCGGDTPRFLNKKPVGGLCPCHQALSRDGRFIYVANYISGSVAVLPVTKDGLGDLIQLVRHEGSGPDKTRQEGPHAHFVAFVPGQDVLVAVDLGLDKLIAYRQNPQTGLLSPLSELRTPPAMGPRHYISAKDGKIAYLLYEMGSAVSALRWTGEGYELLDTLSTLPEGTPRGVSYGAAIRLNADETRLYASNRGHDSIAVCALDGQGGMRFEKWIPSFGKTPRDFLVLEDGRLLVANQDTGDVCLVEETKDGGRLVAREGVPGAVCLCP